MSRNIARLLTEYFKDSGAGWLCAAMALQFLVTSAVWGLGVRQELLPGVLLLVIANRYSTPKRGLVWQMLPVSGPEIDLAIWWATAFLPAVALSLALLLAVPGNRSAGWPIPSALSIPLQIAGIWAAVGYTTWLPERMQISPRSGAISRLLVTWGAPLLVTFYGYPLRTPIEALSAVVMAVGCVLFVLSFFNARSGFRRSTRAVAGARKKHRIGSPGATITALGWYQIIIHIARQVAGMLIIGLGGSCLLRLIYPRATEALLWIFVAAAAMWSNFAAQRWQRSLWPWRCLPLTLRHATLGLQVAQLLPLGVTLLAAWILGHLAPEIMLPMPGWLPPAVIAVSAWANSQARSNARRQSAGHPLDTWLASCFAASYVSILLVARPLATHFDWVPALIWGVAGLLLIGSFKMTLAELRSPDPIRHARSTPGR